MQEPKRWSKHIRWISVRREPLKADERRCLHPSRRDRREVSNRVLCLSGPRRRRLGVDDDEALAAPGVGD